MRKGFTTRLGPSTILVRIEQNRNTNGMSRNDYLLFAISEGFGGGVRSFSVVPWLFLFALQTYPDVDSTNAAGRDTSAGNAAHSDMSVETRGPRSVEFGIAYPPIHNGKARKASEAWLSELGVSVIRFSVDWRLIEPVRGSYRWRGLDARLRFAEDHSLKVMLTIKALGPEWACARPRSPKSCVFADTSAYREFVQRLLERYAGKISRVQFGNEWDLKHWYAGTPREYVLFNNITYEQVQRHAPGTRLVLGGITKAYSLYVLLCKEDADLGPGNVALQKHRSAKMWRSEHKRKCSRGAPLAERVEYVFANARYDCIDVHLYDDCENWPRYIDVLGKLSDAPIVLSEFGGPNPNYEHRSESYHAQRLGTCLDVVTRLPIEQAYYFPLVNLPKAPHGASGLVDGDLRRKQAYSVLKDFLNPDADSAGGSP